MQPTVFKAVPFNPKWIDHEKIDVHAIYRRPILSEENGEQLVDEHGVPRWDLTGGLPVRRHNDWIKKGFQYVTLADSKSLANKNVLKGLIEDGHDPKSFIMLRNRMVGASPWNPQLYLSSQAAVDRSQADKLTQLVEQLGSAAVLAVRQLEDPTFQLPAHLRDIPPGGKVALPSPTSVAKAAPAAAPGKRVKLGPEAGDEIPICTRCGKDLPENAYGSTELPDALFCSEACLNASLPKVARKSVIGRARKQASKRGTNKVPRPEPEPVGVDA